MREDQWRDSDYEAIMKLKQMQKTSSGSFNIGGWTSLLDPVGDGGNDPERTVVSTKAQQLSGS